MYNALSFTLIVDLKSLLTDYKFYLGGFLGLIQPWTVLVTSLLQGPLLETTAPTLNPGLLSSLSAKHPPLLYLSILIGFWYRNLSLFFVTVAIILGSWWAGTEFNWGGFWSYDFVELTVAYIWVFLVIRGHSFSRNVSRLKSFISGMTLYCVCYFMLKFSLISSVHSFIQTNVNYYPYFFISALLFISGPFILCYVAFWASFTHIAYLLWAAALCAYLVAAPFRGRSHKLWSTALLSVVAAAHLGVASVWKYEHLATEQVTAGSSLIVSSNTQYEVVGAESTISYLVKPADRKSVV